VATDSVSDGLMVWAHGELVGFLAVAPTEVRTGVLGLGPPRRPDRLAESFHLASRAVECAIAFGLTGVQGFDTLGLLPAIVADTDVGESLRRRYVRPAAGLESQPDLLRTIRMYFSCDMHVERTAKALFLHANTLRYRIARFEELTGATLRTPASAMEVWWALQHDSFVCRAA
jgi:DNA-binding PucR family transcriptional regulator